MDFSKKVLKIETEAEAERISRFIREQVLARYKRKGVVVGISGGVDSALMAALSVRALGAEKVLGLIMPEKESSPVSEPYGREQAQALGIQVEYIDLTPLLSALGVYEKKTRVIRRLCGDYEPDRDKTKISLPGNLLERAELNVFSLTVEKPDGTAHSFRLGPEDFRSIYAAQNIKTRMRMIQLYYHGEKNHYVVGGTTNRTEMEQGFFVKYGDGGVDIEPIAHLYKTQVLQLARSMGVIERILKRRPSPDTWSGEVGDEEFYFRMPFEILDLLLYAWNHGVAKDRIREVLGLRDEQIDRAFRDFESKSRATWHLRCVAPSLMS